MSDEKKKVKDLAVDLGLTPKDILAAAKDLGITSAKVAASSLSDSDISRLRGHFSPAAGADKQEVIVRRRRKPDEGASAPEPARETEAAQPPADAVAEAVASPARQPAEAAGGEAETASAAPPAAPKAKRGAAQEKSASAAPVTTARIVQRPEATASQDAPKAEAETPSSAGAVTQADAVKETATPDKTQAEPAAPAPRARKQAAAVDAPTETPAAAAPEQAVKSEAAPEQESAAQGDESGTKEAQAPPAKKTFARVVRPAAFSAEPERGADGQALSSAPALPPRSEYEDGDASRGGRQPGDEQTTSQVRIISRPDARQAPDRPRPQYQDGQRTGGFRPRPDGQGGAPRPAGGAPRPAGGRPAPSGPGGRPAPSGAGGRPGGFAPRPAGGAPGSGFAPPSPDSEQGRKKRQKGRRTVEFTDNRARGSDDDSAWGKSASRRGKSRKSREIQPMGGTQPVKAVKRKIKVDEFIRVSDLAHQMGLKSGEIIKVLFSLGVMATINQSLDIDTATLVAGEFGYEIEKVGFSEQEIIDAQQDQVEENPEDSVTRPPVVTIMGHVDHGKTSLLDAIRKSSVVTGEAGGITQHIGAYHVKTKKGEIVFLDTPGHEAFTAMRARGAEVTDIVVLVVAADDGVMEQTKEAINHARAAKVPIMVAVNKMDKEAANPDRVKRELAEQGLVPEEWGGDTTFSYVSAKTRLGLDDLLELLALQAEILELKANPMRSAVGHIIEAKLDKGRGSLGTVLIQQGTLRLGDSFVCGVHSGRVRAMFSDQGKKIKEAGPSMPVEVQGFEGVPEAGEEFICIADERAARRIAEARALKQRERELAKESKITLETFLARKADSVEAAVLNLVLKADVQGSLEAITDALNKLSTDKVRINVIHGGTGGISESDVLLSTASNAIIIGFNVRPSTKAKELAEQEKVDIRFYDIIYKLVEEIKSAMEGMLAPVSREVFLGTADVRETFSVPKVGQIAGSHVSDGKVARGALVRLLRNGVVVHTGKISSLRRFKDDVREVAKGYECGIGLDHYHDVKVGDVIEAFEIVEEAATL